MNYSIENIYEDKNKVFKINEFSNLVDIINSYNIKCTNNYDRTFLLEFDNTKHSFGFEKDNTILDNCIDKWLQTEKINITTTANRVYNVLPLSTNTVILRI